MKAHNTGDVRGPTSVAVDGNVALYNGTGGKTLKDGGTVASVINTAGAVMESDYGADSILAATTAGTPASLTVAASTIVGRTAAGHPAALSAAEVRTIINVADGADVTSANAPQAHAASHVAGDAIQEATAAQKGLMSLAYAGKLDNIETGADKARVVHTQEIMTSTDLVSGAPGNTFVYRWFAPDFATTITAIDVYYLTPGTSAAGTYTFAAASGATNLLSAATFNLETLAADTLTTAGLTGTAANLNLAANAVVTVTVASSNADLAGQTGAYFRICAVAQ